MASQIQASQVELVNSTSNSTVNSKVKQENGFCIIASLQNSSTTSYVANYMALSFDSVPAISMKRTANVTSYPVEDSSEISDHVQIKNRTFSLSGTISETPIRTTQDLLYSSGVSGTRVAQALVYLDKIIEARQVISLLTEQQVYTNIILKGISCDFKSEYSQTFVLDFEQIRVASTKSVNVIATKTASTKVTGTTNKTAAPSANLTERVQQVSGGSNNG